uniref:Uncharacterized protein n=1 Tax=Anguilla anguilla TaxID=7936 RepID=A0A0E9XYW3_ANGAN
MFNCTVSFYQIFYHSLTINHEL